MKQVSDNIAKAFSGLGASIKSLAKVAIQSRRATISPDHQGGCLIILGNGPSLRDTIALHSDTLKRYPTLAVNFAANAPEFHQLRPRYYVLADPHFFNPAGDPNVERLINSINSVDFPMTLFVPTGSDVSRFSGANLKIERFNAIGAEGWWWLTRWLYNIRRAMPRPRNVLIPSIMIGLWLGFKEIYLTGADHSWMRTLSVSDDNEVVSIQPHFYKDDDKEKARVSHEYRNYHLHHILYSFYVAFRSYFDIERYARSIGASVYNSTPGSFIDAFPRRPLP